MYPTTIDEDLELLRDEAAAPRGSPTRVAIQARLYSSAFHSTMNVFIIATCCSVVSQRYEAKPSM